MEEGGWRREEGGGRRGNENNPFIGNPGMVQVQEEYASSAFHERNYCSF
jgi:hypothetical protein